MATITIDDVSYLLNRIILEVRYDESILFQDVRYIKDIQKSLKNKFPDVKLKDNGYNFVNNELKYQVVIDSMKTSVISDASNSISNFKQLAMDAVDSSITKQEIQEFTRIGFRIFLCQETTSFITAAELLKNKLQTFSGLFSEAKENNKLKVSFTYTDDNFNYNINVLPQSEVEIKFNENFDPNTFEKIGLIYDIDVSSIQKISNTGINAFYRSASQRAESIVSHLNKLFGG